MSVAPERETEAPPGVLLRFLHLLRSGLHHLALLPVYLWRSTAPMRAPRCRFHPSCSTYAVDAVRGHGLLRGGVLATRRLGRCHPWNAGGFDHVPDPSDRSAWRRRR
jgi:putative membrane protein insertion efficiency factor